MTFSMELLPAPFGPMMARISCSRTSKETPWSAFTPPKERDTSSTTRMGAPASLGWVIAGGSRRLESSGDVVDFGLGNAQVGRDHPGAPVLETHLRLDVAVRAAGIQGVDQRAVLLADVAPAHLARTRQLAVVGVELLVKDEEAPDLRTAEGRIAGEVAVDRLDATAQKVVHGGLRSEVDVPGVRQAALLGPVADRLHVDVDDGADHFALVPEADGFLDVGKELELVLEIFGREQCAVCEPAYVPRPVDDLEVSVGIEVAGVAGVEEAFGIDRLASLIGPLVVPAHDPRGANQHFAGIGDAHLDARHGPADGLKADLSRRVHAHRHAGFRHPVELLEVDTYRAVEVEQVGPDCLAAGVGHADARQAEHVLQRPVHQQAAQAVEQAV